MCAECTPRSIIPHVICHRRATGEGFWLQSLFSARHTTLGQFLMFLAQLTFPALPARYAISRHSIRMIALPDLVHVGWESFLFPRHHSDGHGAFTHL